MLSQGICQEQDNHFTMVPVVIVHFQRETVREGCKMIGLSILLLHFTSSPLYVMCYLVFTSHLINSEEHNGDLCSTQLLGIEILH